MPIFKFLAAVVAMLPVLVMSAFVIWMIEVLLCIGVLLVLYVTGVLADFSDIPRRYEVLGLLSLIAIAVGLAGINCARYIALVVRNE
jgi:hypothetical protein